MDPRLANMLSRVLPIRLISLLGCVAGLLEFVGERMVGPDPCEYASEESGPKLDLGLSCCDVGRSDKRLIQELCEDSESRAPSAELAVSPSPGRTYDCRLVLGGFGEVICLPAVGGGRVELMGCEKSGEGCGWSYWKLGPSTVWDKRRAEAVPGRELGGGVGDGLARGSSER